MNLKALIALAALGAAACSPPAAPVPAPVENPPVEAAAPTEISYACTDGLRFVIVQDLDAGAGVFQVEGGGPGVAVEKAVVASGFAYYGESVRFHGHGDEALLNYRSDPERSCRLVAGR